MLAHFCSPRIGSTRGIGLYSVKLAKVCLGPAFASKTLPKVEHYVDEHRVYAFLFLTWIQIFVRIHRIEFSYYSCDLLDNLQDASGIL